MYTKLFKWGVVVNVVKKPAPPVGLLPATRGSSYIVNTLLYCYIGSSESGGRPKACTPRPGQKGEMHVILSEFSLSSATFLLNLYNMLENSYGRFFVYMKALEVAANGKVTEHIMHSFKKIDTLLKEWNLGLKDQRKLFLAISILLKEQKSSAKENFKFLTKYLAMFFGEDADCMDEAKEQAAYTISDFVKASNMFQETDHLSGPKPAQQQLKTEDLQYCESCVAVHVTAPTTI